MCEKIEIEISIPSDNDGFVLLQCAHCGTYFKATPDDIEDDGILHLFCPSCGLVSDDYMTEDVKNLALTMTENYAMDILYDDFKKVERKFDDNLIKFQVSSKSDRKSENRILSTIDAMKITYFPCCKRKAKIKPLLRMTGCYCPFCGVKNYDIEH